MDDNGILPRVPGACVAEGADLLPDPDTTTELEGCAEVDAGSMGKVRIYYRLIRYKRGKYGHSFWSAYRADQIG